MSTTEACQVFWAWSSRIVCHVAACSRNTTLLKGWHVLTGSHKSPASCTRLDMVGSSMTQTCTPRSHLKSIAHFQGKPLAATPGNCSPRTGCNTTKVKCHEHKESLPHVCSCRCNNLLLRCSSTREVLGTGPTPENLSWDLHAASWDSVCKGVHYPRLTQTLLQVLPLGC